MLYKLLLITTLALLYTAAILAAPTVHFAPVPGWVVQAKATGKAPGVREVSDGNYLALYEKEVNIASQEIFYRSITDIVSESGIQEASDMSVSFDPTYQQLTIHHITVWRDGRPMDRLNKSAFKVLATETDLSMFMYNGNYSAYTILDDIRKGDKIEYAYTVKGFNPVFEGKFFMTLGFQAGNPISQIHYSITAPSAKQYNLRYTNNAAKPIVTNNGNTQLIEWNVADIKAYNFSANVPTWFDPIPCVQLSEYKSWSEVADWGYRINTPTANIAGAAGKRLEQLKSQYGKDSDGLLRAITNVVQNEVRYMGVEIGISSHKAHRPEKVYDQRYGDCKDKALLLVSMLRAAGIDANVALVNSGDVRKADNSLPSPSAFNHAIVLARLAGKNVWIDATMSDQGGTGADIYCPDYGKALVLFEGNTALTSMAAPLVGSTTCKEIFDINDGLHPTTLTVVTTYTQGAADDMRRLLAGQSKAEMEKSYLNYYSKTYPQIESADTINITDDNKTNKLEITEKYTIRDFFTYDSSEQSNSASFYASMISRLLPEPGNKRNAPIALVFPDTTRYQIRVNSWNGWNIPSKNDKITRNAYEFWYNIYAEGDTLCLNYSLTSLKDNIAEEEIAQYEQDRKVIMDDRLSYGISPGGASAQKAKNSDVNYLVVLAMIVVVVGCAHMGYRIYTTQTAADPYAFYDPRPLGGWLLLPLAGLVLGACQMAYTIVKSGFFNTANWQAYNEHANGTLLKMLIWVEITGNSAMICLNIFCLVLMLKKRDILPRFISILYIASFVFVAFDVVAIKMLLPEQKFDGASLIRSLVAACIWVPYFARSARVRQTFIVPYTRK